MRMSRGQLTSALAALLALVAVAAGCGGEEGAGTTTVPSSDVRVALVTDIGGLNDKGFNNLANKGLQRAKAQLGVRGRVFISKSAGTTSRTCRRQRVRGTTW
jgi:basic membrane protein A